MIQAERTRSDPADVVPSSESWTRDALCTQTMDPDVFFPEPGVSAADAKKICGMCTVRVECLTYALNNNETFGVWGGLTPRDRARITGPSRVRTPEYKADRAAAKRQKRASDPEYRAREAEKKRQRWENDAEHRARYNEQRRRRRAERKTREVESQ